MSDSDAMALLQDVGVDELSYRALALLPLVQVAWADGEVQPAEAELIRSCAKDRWKVGSEGMRTLENWLTYPPTPEFLERGRQALLAVAGAEGSELPADVTDDVLSLAKRVAEAAGGFFGFGAVSNEEAAVLAELARKLRVGARSGSAPAGTSAPERVTKFTITVTMTDVAVGNQDGVVEIDSDLSAGQKAGIERNFQMRSDGVSTSQRVKVDEKGLVLGSSDEADMFVSAEDDDSIAPKHFHIFKKGFDFYVKDFSESGTWVNDERIVERRLLGGERIQAGGVVLRFKRLTRIKG